MLNEYFREIVTAVIATTLGAVTWLIRTVLTSKEKISLLENEIKTRDLRRNEDREFWLNMQESMQSGFSELKEDQNEIKRDILNLYKNVQK